MKAGQTDSSNPVISDKIAEFQSYLRREERSVNTIEKYIRDLWALSSFLNGRELDKELLLSWKEYLVKTHAPASVNSMLAAVNTFLDWLELPGLKVKPFRIQREIFAKPERELTAGEYKRLVTAAENRKNRRLSLLLQTVCSTGIRISELQFITVESAVTGRAQVDCKGKTRIIFLPSQLCRVIRRYCREQGIESGMVFRTRTGHPLDRSNIWKDMKSLCKSAGVESGKVFPHNLRHLFARTYYALEKDMSRLADLLGHSNVSTTRIYTMESGREHARQIDQMGLIMSGLGYS